ncbi:hypothetical protein FQN54_004598 [Arachnomyces sp. PD_36]|nr:hypothetical protein FQN54_004598 [Arachnomyces sp. PD_36]
MFEDFSFSSPSSNGPARRSSLDVEDEMMVDCDSTLISPFSSRCPSPSRRLSRVSKPHSRSSHSRSQSFYARHLPPPTSIPDSHNAKRLSVGALTQKLHDHSLNHEPPHSANASRRSSLAPPQPFPLPHSQSSSQPTSTNTSPPTALRPNDLLTPPPDTDLDDDPSTQLQRTIRNQRQKLSTLQCAGMTAAETVRLALLMEEDECLRFPGTADDEQHPSSLPPTLLSPMRKVAMNQSRRHYQRQNPDGSIASIPVISRSGSINRRGPLTAAGSSSKIEKSHAHPHFSSCSPSLYPSSRRASRSHAPPTPASGAGHLQRKGNLVNAAVAAMMERSASPSVSPSLPPSTNPPPNPSGVQVHIDDVDGLPLPLPLASANGVGGDYYYHHEDYLNNPSSYRIQDSLLFSAPPSAHTTPAPSRRGSEITSMPAPAHAPAVVVGGEERK